MAETVFERLLTGEVSGHSGTGSPVISVVRCNPLLNCCNRLLKMTKVSFSEVGFSRDHGNKALLKSSSDTVCVRRALQQLTGTGNITLDRVIVSSVPSADRGEWPLRGE
jgi:hypothetical protein